MKFDLKYLYVAVFSSGMTALALEMSASRLLGNVFGTSNLVWACIIGLILIYLTLGYTLGGWWADRSPSPKTLYRILIWAAFSVGLVPLASRPVLRISAAAFDKMEMAVLFGTFTAVIFLFIIPVTLLGTVSPFAIRLALRDPRHTGVISGRLSAISTLGSFVGTFLPVLVLIPTIGTYRTFLTFSGFLFIIGMIGLLRCAGWRSILPYLVMPLITGILTWFVLQGPDKNPVGLVYETESAYNYIQVLKQGDYTLLRLNDGQGVHSIYNPSQLNYYGPWEQVLVAPFFNNAPYDLANVKSMAIVGLAAGTTARQATAVYGAIPIDGFEIDPVIIDVGKRFFNMTEPNLTTIPQDGRWGLAHSAKRYQIISIDAYRPPYIPWHLTTREFFIIARQHLTDDGVLVINIGRSPTDRGLIDALGTTIGSVFPSIYVMDVPNTFNSVLFATVQPTQASNLTANLANLSNQKDSNPLLLDTMRTTLVSLQPAPAKTQVFTDDVAPIEWLTNNLVLNYLLTGDTSKLQ
jgi:predicted membrane-bound spermidine synthase